MFDAQSADLPTPGKYVPVLGTPACPACEDGHIHRAAIMPRFDIFVCNDCGAVHELDPGPFPGAS